MCCLKWTVLKGLFGDPLLIDSVARHRPDVQVYSWDCSDVLQEDRGRDDM